MFIAHTVNQSTSQPTNQPVQTAAKPKTISIIHSTQTHMCSHSHRCTHTTNAFRFLLSFLFFVRFFFTFCLFFFFLCVNIICLCQTNRTIQLLTHLHHNDIKSSCLLSEIAHTNEMYYNHTHSQETETKNILNVQTRTLLAQTDIQFLNCLNNGRVINREKKSIEKINFILTFLLGVNSLDKKQYYNYKTSGAIVKKEC